MLRKIGPGQTAGPIGLKFFVEIHGWPGVLQAILGPSASLTY